MDKLASNTNFVTGYRWYGDRPSFQCKLSPADLGAWGTYKYDAMKVTPNDTESERRVLFAVENYD